MSAGSLGSSGFGMVKAPVVAAVPWHVVHFMSAYFFASNVVKTSFIFGVTTSFMYLPRASLSILSQLNSGAADAAGAADSLGAGAGSALGAGAGAGASG